LLLSQFARLRSRALLILATGYLFDGLMLIPHALSFPGVFAQSGLMGAGPQTTAWLYMWHGGFPLFVLAYALLFRRQADALAGSLGVAVAVAVSAVVVLVVVLTLLATAGHDLLPIVMRGSPDAALPCRRSHGERPIERCLAKTLATLGATRRGMGRLSTTTR
jgi:Membrane-associated sensor, integral membrane domain